MMKRKISIFNIVFLLGIFCVAYLFFPKIGTSRVNNSETIVAKNLDRLSRVLTCDKWVVITTINYPTEHVKYMRNSLNDWCIVVLGDRKTPVDWFYEKIVYLSLNDQLLMSKKFKLIDKIPQNSYLRKIVGYLYAMEHGARVIYETDDDNSARDALTGFKFDQFDGLERDCREEESIFINPYSYFGQTSIWPRGYPLEDISENNPPTNCSHRFVRVKQVPLIQQGLVNGDPDMDAIYRLTRKQNSRLLYVEFDRMAPKLVLNRGQYAPINSQNTYFHYDSFWTLLFPLNVTFRECDIFRGYIATRLLQEIDGRVGYWPPNAIQIRNPHSYIKDFMEEKRLYEKIGEFVRDVDEWKCTSNHLDKCMLELIGVLIKRGHFDTIELDFYRTWLDDLNTLGYKWPSLNRNGVQSTASMRPKIFHKSIEQPHSSNSNDNEESELMKRVRTVRVNKLKKLCQLNFTPDEEQIAANQIRNISLIAVATNKHQLEYVNNFLGLHFERVIICLIGSSIRQNYLNQFVSKSTGMTIVQTETFAECLNMSISLYDLQNQFVVVKNLTSFSFWLEDMNLEPANLSQLYDEKATFLLNKSQNETHMSLNKVNFNLNNVEKYKAIDVYCDYWSNNELFIKNLMTWILDSFNEVTHSSI